ncbi:MAG: deoxyribose-phosphate aldolase [Acholeplasmatales bacterium]|nr:deoxyribose-phosphate aldolase [Acholeplasmatales bacterium]
MNYNEYIDHTNLKAFAKLEDIVKLCSEANYYKFKSVCVNPAYIETAKELLKDSGVLICTVIGFPLGQNTTEVKKFEVTDAIAKGADEVDVVLNIAELKNKNYDYVLNELKEVVKAANGVLVKLIIETCYLDNDEIKKVCELASLAEIDYVKTSTGFGTGGAKFEDVKLMKESIKPNMKVKASGGIKSKDDFLKMIEAGASRIGTSSGVQIMEDLNE